MSAEHAYQSEKTTDPIDRETIYNAPNPSQAKRLGGKKYLHSLRADWDRIKDAIMLQILREKFFDSDLRMRLLETGDQELVEMNWWNDTYWGVCNGIGKNKLGKLLMQVREEIK